MQNAVTGLSPFLNRPLARRKKSMSARMERQSPSTTGKANSKNQAPNHKEIPNSNTQTDGLWEDDCFLLLKIRDGFYLRPWRIRLST
jgi:hypothetical protein